MYALGYTTKIRAMKKLNKTEKLNFFFRQYET